MVKLTIMNIIEQWLIKISNLPSVDKAIWLQAISAIVLTWVTFLYLLWTRKLVRSQYRAYLDLVDIQGDSLIKWNLRVINRGPGIAKNIKVKTIILRDVVFFNDNTLRVWVKSELLLADGPRVISPNEEAIYHLKHIITFQYPFFIEWETISGERLRIGFVRRDNHFLEISRLERLKFKIKWAIVGLLSPLMQILKWLQQRTNKKNR